MLQLFNNNDNRFGYLIQENVLDLNEFIAGGKTLNYYGSS